MTVHLQKPSHDEPRSLVDVGKVIGKALLVAMILGFGAGILLAGVLHG